MAISKRIPKLNQLLPVYAIIVAIVYSWTILWFFWKMPSWLYYLNIGEILTIFAYAMVTNLIESLMVLLAPVIASLFLPQGWFHDQFIARGTALVASGLGYMIYIAYQYQSSNGLPRHLLLTITGPVFVLILLVVFLSGKLTSLRRGIEAFADRATILIYLSIPISMLSLFVVIVRNIF